MKNQNSTISELEKTLQEIGDKIELLIKQGADAGADVKEDIEEKIKDLKNNKTTLEAELKKGKDLVMREYRERSQDFKPKLEESKGLLKDGLRQIGLAIKTLIAKR